MSWLNKIALKTHFEIATILRDWGYSTQDAIRFADKILEIFKNRKHKNKKPEVGRTDDFFVTRLINACIMASDKWIRENQYTDKK